MFKDPFAIEWSDDREGYGEDRYVIIGMVDSRLLYVAYTMRGTHGMRRLIMMHIHTGHQRRRAKVLIR